MKKFRLLIPAALLMAFFLLAGCGGNGVVIAPLTSTGGQTMNVSGSSQDRAADRAPAADSADAATEAAE